MRAAALAMSALLSVAMQPPAESSLGTMPTPPVVGMTGGTGAETPVVDHLEIWKYAITQGGLAAVLLVVFWSYRRDFLTLISRKDEEAAKDRREAAEDRRAFIVLVEKNITALVVGEQTNARLSRAIEARKLVPPGDDR